MQIPNEGTLPHPNNSEQQDAGSDSPKDLTEDASEPSQHTSGSAETR
jgi:hypothetical protein